MVIKVECIAVVQRDKVGSIWGRSSLNESKSRIGVGRVTLAVSKKMSSNIAAEFKAIEGKERAGTS